MYNLSVLRASYIQNFGSNLMKIVIPPPSDENGDTIVMTLWNGQCTKFNVDDDLTIRNAFVKDGQEYHQGYGMSQRTELGTYKNASTI